MQFEKKVFPSAAEIDAEGFLAIDGVAVSEIANEFSTPVMIYSSKDITDETKKFVEVFDRVLYASKAAPIIGLEKLIFAQGAGCDVASVGELEVALRSGCDPQMIVMHGNNKSDDEIRRCIEVGISRIVVEDSHECDRIERIANELGVSKVEVELRLTPGVEAHTHEAIMTGAIDSKFGSTIEFGTAREMVDRIVSSSKLVLKGFHCHIGSQIFDTEPLAQAARIVAEFFVGLHGEYLEKGIDFDINEINVGGGFGICYSETDDPPPTIEMATAVKAAVHEVCAKNNIHDIEVWVEPGRALVGRAGVTVYKVGSVKKIPKTRNYIAVEGGMSDNLRPAIYGAEHAVRIDGKDASHESIVATVAGKHCEEGDRLAVDVALPSNVEVDDLLIQASTGAYSYAMSSNYNMFTRPAVVLVDSDNSEKVKEIVRRETIEDILTRQRS